MQALVHKRKESYLYEAAVFHIKKLQCVTQVVYSPVFFFYDLRLNIKSTNLIFRCNSNNYHCEINLGRFVFVHTWLKPLLALAFFSFFSFYGIIMV